MLVPICEFYPADVDAPFTWRTMLIAAAIAEHAQRRAGLEVAFCYAPALAGFRVIDRGDACPVHIFPAEIGVCVCSADPSDSPHVVRGSGDAIPGLWNPECQNPLCVAAREAAAVKAHAKAVKASRTHRTDPVDMAEVLAHTLDHPNLTEERFLEAMALTTPTVWGKRPSGARSLQNGAANDLERVNALRLGEEMRTAARHFAVRPIRASIDREEFIGDALREFLEPSLEVHASEAGHPIETLIERAAWRAESAYKKRDRDLHFCEALDLLTG